MKNEFEISIQLNATAEDIWDALINPAKVKQYMYESEVKSDWKVGSRMEYRMMKEGKPLTIVNGIITNINAPFSLSHTLFPTGAGYPDIPENHLTIAYEIMENEKGARLLIRQSGFEKVADGKNRYQHSLAGWGTILEKLKSVAENE